MLHAVWFQLIIVDAFTMNDLRFAICSYFGFQEMFFLPAARKPVSWNFSLLLKSSGRLERNVRPAFVDSTREVRLRKTGRPVLHSEGASPSVSSSPSTGATGKSLQRWKESVSTSYLPLTSAPKNLFTLFSLPQNKSVTPLKPTKHLDFNEVFFPSLRCTPHTLLRSCSCLVFTVVILSCFALPAFLLSAFTVIVFVFLISYTFFFPSARVPSRSRLPLILC